jgi:hypothetical protein
VIGHIAQARVAGREFRPGVADADYRAPVENIRGKALALHPAAMNESVSVFGAVALAAAQSSFRGRRHFAVPLIPSRTGQRYLYYQYTMA